MLITRFDELMGVADGERVEVQGRYERYNPNMAPPGDVPVSARVVLLGGGGVLIGRFYDPESRRPDPELAALEGAIVRIAGTFFHTRAFPGPGPPPGLWAGGGAQIVDVGPLQWIEAAKPIATASPVRIPEPIVAPPPVAPPPAPIPREIYVPVPSTIPSSIGSLARRSLAGWMGVVVFVVAMLVTAAGLFVALPFLGLHLRKRDEASYIMGGGILVGWGVATVTAFWLAARQLRWLASLPWTFDVPLYVAQLNDERTENALFCVDIELVAPVGNASPFDPRRLGGATVVWTRDRALSISRPRDDTTPGFFYIPSGAQRPTTSHVHRWFRRCVIHALMPLHASLQIRTIKTRIE